MANDEFFSGLIRNEASREYLANEGRAFGGSAAPLAYPPSLDPRPIIRVENQGDRNSCVGHGLSSSGEICAYLDSGATLKVQYSRWGCYIWSQSLSGPRPGKTWLGADQGAGVDGAVKAAVKYGFPPESVWPYPPASAKYSTKVPAGAVEAAAPTQLLSHINIKSYDQGFEWINQGKGSLIIGVDWTTGLRDNHGDITLSDLNTRVIGGHCMFIWGYDEDGLLWVGNSHSTSWGGNGWRKARPEVVDRWARQEEVYGLSDLKDITVSRPVLADFGEGM